MPVLVKLVTLLLHLVGTEKHRICRAKLCCIRLAALLFVRILVSFSILTNKLLANVTVRPKCSQ